MTLSRRQLLEGGAAFFSAAAASRGEGAAGSIARIEHLGMLISECGVPGEQRRDDVVPAHPNGIQVSRGRWLLVYATRGFRGVDDDRSIVYQLRAGSPTGRIVREGMLVPTRDDWEPFGPGGGKFVKQHGHPVLFGVPRGARIGGKPAPSANVFVLKWRQVARVLDPERRMLVRGKEDEAVRQRTQSVGWLQLRLNDREDGLEILQPAAQLRQRGFAEGPAFCGAPGVRWMNQTYTQAVPLNADATAWADCNYFDAGQVAALEYTFDAALGRYEWTRTGAFLFPGEAATEPSLARSRTSWVVAARTERRGVLWVSTADPFAAPVKRVWSARPASPSPRTAYACPDGVLRLLTGDPETSPYSGLRDPLYLWDIDPDEDFRPANPRVVYDSVRAGLPIRRAATPMVDMAKLLPHRGKVQYLLHRVVVQSYNHPYVGSDGAVSPRIPVINAEEKAACGIYCARITYRNARPPLWDF